MAGRVNRVPASEFRQLVARWATGVTVVTAIEAGRPHGLTVNAFLSIALEPPTVLVSLGREADTMPVVDRTGAFAVNFLAHDQRAISDRFAAVVPPDEKFAALEWAPGADGLPLLAGTLGSLSCEVVSKIDVADHRLFVAEVRSLRADREAPPLLFFRSQYAEPAADGATRLPSAPPRREPLSRQSR